MNLDHTQDLTGKDQHRLTQLYSPPAFVKQANHEQLYGDPTKLPPHLYAGATKRVYPCHTKAATWMSALFFGDKRKNIPQPESEAIQRNLVKMATHFGIVNEINTLWAKMAADALDGLSQLPDDVFALVWDTGDRKERHYPLRNAAEVKMASHWFGNYHQDFTFSDKHTIANKIMVKAAEFGAGIENAELIDRCAGFGYCAASDAAAAWEKRAGLVRTRFPDYSDAAVKLAKSIKEATFEARDQGRRVKMAGLMDTFDRQTELYKLYDAGGLERPEEVLFKITEKVASEFLRDHVQTTTGAVYEKMALQKLPINIVRQWMGDDIADAVGGYEVDMDKLASVLPTLPRPDAEMFEQMARSIGVQVFAREKGAMHQGLTPDEMTALAAEYGQGQSLTPMATALI